MIFRSLPWKKYASQSLGELFSTCLLIFIGNLSIAQKKFTPVASRSDAGVHISYGIAVYVALIIGVPVSGAHINPAVSVGLLSARKIGLIQFVFYVFGQIAGGFVASILVYIVYLSHFNLHDGGIRRVDGLNGTADIFYTVPHEGIPHWNCLIDSIIGTALLLIFVMALGNTANPILCKPCIPFAYVLLVTVFGFAMTINCGNPINPARDFGPRLFASCIYGVDVFRVNNYYFWIPIVGPTIGSVIGVWVYEGYMFVTRNCHSPPEQEPDRQNDRLDTSSTPTISVKNINVTDNRDQ